MKKLFVMASALFAAIVVNAATITWSATAAGTVLPGGATANNVVAYLFEGTLDKTALQTALDAGTWAPTSEAGFLYTKNTTSTGLITQAKIGSYENETVSFSMVIFDTAAIGTEGMYKYAEVKNVEFTTANKTIAFATPLQAADWVAYGVPEPTSGLLLLLGMGALALRRKQA